MSDAQGRFEHTGTKVHRQNYGTTVVVAAFAQGFSFVNVRQRRAKLRKLDPLSIRLKRSNPLVLRLVDAEGVALHPVDVLPYERIDSEGSLHLWQDKNAANWQPTGMNGQVTLTGYNVGDKCTVFCRLEDGSLVPLKFDFAEESEIELAVPGAPSSSER